MGPTLSEVERAFGAAYDFINNAVRRGLLTTDLMPTTPGVARRFSRANVLEIAFLAALVDVGFTPKEASAIAEEWLEHEVNGSLGPWFIINRCTGKWRFASSAGSIDGWASALPDDDDTPGGWGEGFEPGIASPATRLAVVNLRELVRRVDNLFSE